MKKILWLPLLAIWLTACSEEEGKEVEEPKAPVEVQNESDAQPKIETDDSNQTETPKITTTEVQQPVPEEQEVQNINNEELKEVIDEYMLGEGDELISSSVTGDQIEVVVNLGEGMFEPSLMAVTSYSQLSDELLTIEGWDKLSIEFVDIGTVSMSRTEKETNELGMDYFPTAKIEGKLKR